MSRPRLDQPFVEGSVDTPAGPAPRVSSFLSLRDRIGSFKARWGVGRMRYTVDPGLYALGTPGTLSPVFVSANYKMSFDRLRECLSGFDAWVLVLDTLGINVWCAAGKGTFGTEELVERIRSAGLSEVVSHRELIVPQLAGPGVSGHQVKGRSGFSVIFGPVEAADIPQFMKNGRKASTGMRLKTFGVVERLVLVPIEVVGALRKALVVLAVLFPVSLLLGGLSWTRAVASTGGVALALGAAIVAGGVATPLLLPWLPGRAFSLKGLIAGVVAVAALFLAGVPLYSRPVELLFAALAIPAMAAYIAMNFTGASTYTSLSGVQKEMRWAFPLEIGAGVVGLFCWLLSVVGGR